MRRVVEDCGGGLILMWMLSWVGLCCGGEGGLISSLELKTSQENKGGGGGGVINLDMGGYRSKPLWMTTAQQSKPTGRSGRVISSMDPEKLKTLKVGALLASDFLSKRDGSSPSALIVGQVANTLEDRLGFLDDYGVSDSSSSSDSLFFKEEDIDRRRKKRGRMIDYHYTSLVSTKEETRKKEEMDYEMYYQSLPNHQPNPYEHPPPPDDDDVFLSEKEKEKEFSFSSSSSRHDLMDKYLFSKSSLVPSSFLVSSSSSKDLLKPYYDYDYSSPYLSPPKEEEDDDEKEDDESGFTSMGVFSSSPSPSPSPSSSTIKELQSSRRSYKRSHRRQIRADREALNPSTSYGEELRKAGTNSNYQMVDPPSSPPVFGENGTRRQIRKRKDEFRKDRDVIQRAEGELEMLLQQIDKKSILPNKRITNY